LIYRSIHSKPFKIIHYCPHHQKKKTRKRNKSKNVNFYQKHKFIVGLPSIIIKSQLWESYQKRQEQTAKPVVWIYFLLCKRSTKQKKNEEKRNQNYTKCTVETITTSQRNDTFYA
jgi:hypothetical protein